MATRFDPPDPAGPLPIRGKSNEPGEKPQIRQELRDFAKNKDQWNLYLMGLWAFQQVPQSKVLSFFQIAGIHGLPFEAWPAGDPNIQKLFKQKTGFCTHTSILFLTWHRPYLALYENMIYEAMRYVAQQATEEEGGSRLLVAANTFRMPYWDWARRDLPVFPEEASDTDTVTVSMPASMRAAYDLGDSPMVKITNPLYSYHFQDGTTETFKVYGRTSTQRWDNGRGTADIGIPEELSPEERKKLILKNMTPFTRDVNQKLPVEGNLTERVMYLLQAYDNFDEVSHNQWDPQRVPDETAKFPKIKGLGFGSFEDIHNAMHNMCGGYGKPDPDAPDFKGHMTNVPISAFDPIFWLHHTNIDRLLAVWQGLHDKPEDPKTYVTTKPAVKLDFGGGQIYGGTWVTLPGDPEGINTPLVPFYKDDGSFWDSEGVRSTTTFGYAYPETQSWKFPTQKAYRADIKKQLVNIYQAGSLANMIAEDKAGIPDMGHELISRAQHLWKAEKAQGPTDTLTALQVAHAPSTNETTDSAVPSLIASLPPIDVPSIDLPTGRSLKALAPNNKYLEWLVNIKAEKHTLGGKYSVHIFLGEVVENSTALYSVTPHHIGTFSPLGQEESTKCGKCRRDQISGGEITGQVPLTIALAERYFAGALNSLSEDDVINYLKTHLHWEVVDGEGQRLQGHRDRVEGLLVGVVSNEVTLPETKNDLPTYAQEITIYPGITTKENGQAGRAEGTGITEETMYFVSTPVGA